MKYINANDVLPAFLIEQIQKHIQGDIIYIPKAQGQRCEWGEKTGVRIEYKKRNEQIKAEYRQGVTTNALADKYNLSIDSIKRIIYS